MTKSNYYTDDQVLRIAVLELVTAFVDDDAISTATIIEQIEDWLDDDVLGLPEDQLERVTDRVKAAQKKATPTRRAISRTVNDVRKWLWYQIQIEHNTARRRVREAKARDRAARSAARERLRAAKTRRKGRS